MAKKQTKKKQPTKPIKKRANKYEEKLQINGSFEDLVKELVTPNKTDKKK
jgi:hypothetical protein